MWLDFVQIVVCCSANEVSVSEINFELTHEGSQCFSKVSTNTISVTINGSLFSIKSLFYKYLNQLNSSRMGKEMLMIFGVLKLWVVKVKMDELRLWRQFSDLFMSTWVVLFMEVPRSYQNGEWWMLIFPAWWRDLSKGKFLYLFICNCLLECWWSVFLFTHVSELVS